MATTNDLFSYQAANASAKAQMEFQERMSNTAHQREVEDLKKAGLNPILSAGGSGASTPTGAEGAVGDENAKLWDTMNQLVNTVAETSKNSSSSVRRLTKTVEKMIPEIVHGAGDDTLDGLYVPDWSSTKDSHDVLHDVQADLQGKNFEKVVSWLSKNWQDAKKVLVSDDPKTSLAKTANDMVSMIDRAIEVAEPKLRDANRSFVSSNSQVKKKISFSARQLAKKIGKTAVSKAGSYGSLNSNWYS